MTFEQELKAAIDQHRGEGFEKLRAVVDAIFAKHGREIPQPITGTIETVDPGDRLQ
jgi:hypothetical protein